mmetsp:Transcript_7125/g.12595  ORF Transcript_7125/g.12595 Transcript_7125/m.12595 type:complete len:343 (-) Transcript_7125:240-1268(-)|eukprot:CAMPEP_0183701912 /NCGR_PEP_ID=MMETSP0737-20130205/150_1 /TAXON_ID=385413 /ORGANISM="Thalassiosira miniscula, Strain CCMP1093" /LENGTH=342 /DNA_ID=CAMNT_0025928419 /DNA_START=53 /DNA_END=1081 /DNA_ORIENTATION=-
MENNFSSHVATAPRASLVGKCTSLVGLLLISSGATAFTSPIFQKAATLQRTAPSKTEGVEIELPDFEEMFGRIQAVSPLAKLAIEGGGAGEGGGFAKVVETSPAGMKWKKVEKNKKKQVHQIDRIDNFQNLGPPLLRWRASMEGPCHGMMFADFIMNVDRRQSWDPQIDNVCELYPIYDLDAANIAMGFGKFGDCQKCGVGYTLTKQHPIGITPREQLTLCGINNLSDGSWLIWGTELEEWHNHLMPEGERRTRARSHLFSIALVPTGDNSFDAEYSLQLDFGGNLPHWMTAPLVLDSVKGMFGVAQPFFNAGEGSELDEFLKEEKIQQEKFEDRNSILFTP